MSATRSEYPGYAYVGVLYLEKDWRFVISLHLYILCICSVKQKRFTIHVTLPLTGASVYGMGLS